MAVRSGYSQAEERSFLLCRGLPHCKLIKTGMAFVLAGAVGNLIDRIHWGYVLDFFEIRGFPIFNVADACITLGAVLIILSILFGGERHQSER